MEAIKMTTEEVYKLSTELTNKDINNILNWWLLGEETEQTNLFNSLVRLGDSRSLAMATTIAEKYNSKKGFEFYYKGYCL